jgi:dienelactone hydrolase
VAARRRRAFQALKLAALLCGVACHGPSPKPRGVSSAASSPPTPAAPIASAAPSASAKPPSASAELPRELTAAAALVPLAVPGFGDAVVSLPLGARERRPIALALHGNFDRPEWQCEVWRRITAGQVFVLCPRGIARRDVPKELDRWEWGSLAKTKSEIVAALAALRSRYPEHVKSGPIVFTGFSLGAILGARLIQDPELGVGAAVLTEGGYQGWTLAKAKALRPSLRRLLFACGQTECKNAYRYQLEGLFQKAELPATVVADVKAGHTYDDPVAALIATEWPGLVGAVEN